MKHIITITSLLAAGTLCANAAVETKTLAVYDFTGNSPLNITEGAGSNLQVYNPSNVSGGGYSISDGDLTFSGATGFYSADGANQAIFEDTTLTNWSLSFTATLDSGATSYNVLQFGGKDRTSNAVPFAFYMGNGSGDRGAFGIHFGDNGSTNNVRFGATNISSLNLSYDNVSTTYTISMNDDQLSLFVNGVDVTSYLTVVYSGSGVTLDEGETLSSYYQKTTHAGLSFTKFGYANEVGALGGVASGTVFSNITISTTIPEPSAFGLLAGLGALALAGTRRRRRKA